MASVQVGDGTILHDSVDDATTEIGTSDGRACLRGVRRGASECSELAIATNQEIQGPAGGSTYLKGAWTDGVSFVGERAQGVLLESDPGSIVGYSRGPS
jgi:hypothetical protein